jgi:hypothetical protein
MGKRAMAKPASTNARSAFYTAVPLGIGNRQLRVFEYLDANALIGKRFFPGPTADRRFSKIFWHP